MDISDRRRNAWALNAKVITGFGSQMTRWDDKVHTCTESWHLSPDCHPSPGTPPTTAIRSVGNELWLTFFDEQVSKCQHNRMPAEEEVSTQDVGSRYGQPTAGNQPENPLYFCLRVSIELSDTKHRRELVYKPLKVMFQLGKPSGCDFYLHFKFFLLT